MLSKATGFFGLFIIVSLLTISVFFLIIYASSEKVGAVGEATGTIPNDPPGNTPWLVVTRPGSNGMDARQSAVDVYVPVSLGNSFNMTVQDACDSTTKDEGGWNNATQFVFGGDQVSNITNLSSGSSLIRGSNTFFIECNSGSNTSFTVTMRSGSEPPTVTINNVNYRVVRLMAAATDTSTAYYANRFRYTAGSGVLFSYNQFIGDPGRDSRNYTGIAYDYPVSNNWGWSTTLGFAQPCGAPSTGGVQVYFFDSDHANVTGRPSSPAWQSNTYPMTYTINAYDRVTGVFIQTIYNNEWLTGGQNDPNHTRTFTMRSDRKYAVTVNNVNYINSIQIALPYPQVYANDTCASSSVGRIDSCILSGNDTVIYGWAFDSDSTNNNQPQVTVNVSGSNQTVNSAFNYRSSQINTFLDNNGYPSSGRDNRYGFRVTYSGLNKGGNYSISGTVLNVGSGSNQAMVVNTSTPINTPGGGFVSGSSNFPGNVIPQACLPDAQSFPINCPSYPPFAAFNQAAVQVTLPQTGKPADQAVPTVATPGSWFGADNVISETYTNGNLTRTVRIRDDGTATRLVYVYSQNGNITNAKSAIDQWGQSAGGNLNSSDFDRVLDLDYRPFFNDYPYDPHTPVVIYTNKYDVNRQTWSMTRIRTYVHTRPNTSVAWPSVYSSQYRVSASNNGWSAAGVTNTVNLRSDWTGDQTVNAPTMPPCFPRTFESTPVTGNATLIPDPEDPNEARLSFTIDFTFGYDQGGSLRTPTRINDLPYTIEYYGRNSAGLTGFNGTINRTATQTTSALANNVNATFSDNASVAVSVPGNLVAGDRVCWVVRIPDSVGTVKGWSNPGDILTRNTEAISDESCSEYVVDIPYTRFYSADIFAGGGFSIGDEACSVVNANASLEGPLRGDSRTTFRGSGTQLAAFAFDQIRGVSPLARQTTRSQEGLAFANTSGVNLNSRLFGGNFGVSSCAHDHFAQDPQDRGYSAINTSQDISGLDGQYYINADVTLSGQLPNSSRVVLYVDGNVRINTAGKFGYVNTSWSTIDEVPSLNVIARGNIYIDNDVTELDGNYVAQPDDSGDGGEIYTCSLVGTDDELVNPNNANALGGACRNQLRINGAFTARNIHFLRTLGSLRESVVAESPNPTRAAETFIYDPLQWIVNGGGLPSNNAIQIDSYTTLPPSL